MPRLTHSRRRGAGAFTLSLSLFAVYLPANGAEELEPIIVTTPMRMAQTVDDSLHPVSVITREDIERLQPTGVPDLIRGLPGVQVGSSGGFGKQTGVFLRGANANQMIVLIDGVRAGSATAGGAAWEFLPVEQIERIEVVRGPRASAYGADAVGGVIQIFTRSPGREPVREVMAGYGRYNTRQAGASVAADSGTWRYHLGVSHLASDGYDVLDGGDPDDDGYRNDAVNARLGYRLDNDVDVELRLMRAQGRTEFDSLWTTGTHEEDFLQQAVSARLGGPAGSAGRWHVITGEMRDERDTLDGDSTFRYDTRRQSVSVQTDWLLDRWQLTLGGDYLHDRVSSTEAFARDSRDSGAVFAQLHTEWSRHLLGVGLRHDRYSDFGSHATGDLAWGYRLDERWRIRASAGTAFRAPTFNDLYFPFGVGNPDLDPERARNVEAGLEYARNGHRLGVNVFENRIRDLIVFDAATFTMQNIDRARITGVEADWQWREGHWQLGASYTWLHARDEASGNRLPRRARHSARADVDRVVGAARYGLSLIGQDRRYDDAANTIEMSGYVTMDLRAAYRIDRRWEVSGAWSNILDRDYETVAGYRQPGQALNVSLRGRF
ncbi:TonB-dependent receptor [Thioalkalivibrio denitrificans]|uniref:TonB-dependent receptor n=1 Tax=Thioalkalivibrio denitrificans TaxID=108003 RepID=A0A1V3NG77_9GAMM|nr:TonB-dependent receptor [Thioalkalivibrio denitrificans]OOG23786.1 TonB-dependent receptor [Thioalkalivibrio denitrificans]